jgi:uncharacterized membrane protein YdfJ with MMPL/SSD domain
VALLVVLALPATKIHLGLPSGASEPTSNTSRRAYDLTTASFGSGFNGALLILADGVDSATTAQQIDTRLAAVPGVETASLTVPQGTSAVFRVIPTAGPNDPATANLVNRIRDDRTTIAGSPAVQVLVGGTTASNIDVSSKLSSALPIFLIVVGLAFLLLTFAFRTILVPVKSIIGFLLSVSAALGAQAAVFQWGWGRTLFDITPSETISFLPIIMLAIIRSKIWHHAQWFAKYVPDPDIEGVRLELQFAENRPSETVRHAGQTPPAIPNGMSGTLTPRACDDRGSFCLRATEDGAVCRRASGRPAGKAEEGSAAVFCGDRRQRGQTG